RTCPPLHRTTRPPPSSTTHPPPPPPPPLFPYTTLFRSAALRRPGFTSQRFGGVRAFRNGREDVQLNRRFQRLGFLKRDHGIENAFRAWLGFRCGCGHELSLLLLKVDASAGKDARLLGDVVANRQFRSVVAQDPLMLAYFLSPRQAR